MGKGFSLIELLITIGIVAVLGTIGTMNLVNYRSRNILDLQTQEIVATLRDAQSRSISQENGRPWGIHFENPTSDPDYYSLFASSTYNSSDINSTTTLNSAVVFLDPSSGNSKNVTFSAVTGLPSAADSITIALNTNNSASSTITISAYGQIQCGGVAISGPTVTTQAATNVEVTTATLNGTITDEGSASTTVAGFDYGLTTDYGSQITSVWLGGTGSFALGISGLTGNTTYHFRAKAYNSSAGWGYGSDYNFTTSQSALACSVAASCLDTTIFKLSATTNAHAEMPSQVNYTKYVCCSGAGLGTSCSGNYDTVLKLSGLTNSHVEKKTQANYANSACISVTSGTVLCDYATDCSTLGSDYICLASISGDTNAHIGDCNAYATKVCCKISNP